MAYSDFTSLAKVKRDLGLVIHDVPRLFADVPPIPVPNGLGQCAAQMYAAHLFNEREGTPQAAIYGAVSTGTNWKFLKFQNNQIQKAHC